MILTRRSAETDLEEPTSGDQGRSLIPDPRGPEVAATRLSRAAEIFRRRPRVQRRSLPPSSPWYLPSAVLGVVAVMLVGFCLQILLVGHVGYARAQRLALADFRYDLARATAPVGQTFTPQPEIQGQAISGEVQAAPVAPVPLLHPLGTPVAVMSIPAIAMRDTVVLEGTTPEVTQDGPGHERNSVLPGQEGWSLLYGRAWSYGGPFGDIAGLRAGDRIQVITGQGKHSFAVTGVRRAGDPIPQRQAGESRLVLGTTAGQALAPNGVVYVDAVLTSPVVPSPPRQFLALAPSEKILAGDTDAWFTILLWAQGLLIAMLAFTWARSRWGRAQSWIVGVPVLAALGIGTADTVALLLPNVL